MEYGQKKKTAEEELDEEFLDESDDFEGLIDDEDDKIDKSKEDLAELLSSQLDDEFLGNEYKYLQLKIEQENEFEYYVTVKHQSHGFMNYFVAKILKCTGVEFAAYKATSLDPPKIYVRLDASHDIKKILQEALLLMRTEWKGMKNAVAAMKL